MPVIIVTLESIRIIRRILERVLYAIHLIAEAVRVIQKLRSVAGSDQEMPVIGRGEVDGAPRPSAPFISFDAY
jgi:hypothetical protein